MKENPIKYDVISEILLASAQREAEDFEDDRVRSWNALRKQFPQLSFSEKDHSYVNPFNNKLVSISKLLSTAFFSTSQQALTSFFSVREIVNVLLNFKKEQELKTSQKYIQGKVDMVNNAVQRRNDHCASASPFSHERYCTASDKICGTYKMLSKNFLVISNKPIDIFMKSTGREWENDSCERIGGDFDDGIYSDIEWSNCIALLYKNSDKNDPIGRVMIRTCEDHESGKPSFGIEPIWYTNKGKMEAGDRIDGVSVERLHEELVTIIEDKGFDMDYGACETPYPYMGYSDREKHGRIVIKYGEGHVNVNEILSSRSDDIYLGTKCPFCDTVYDWAGEFDGIGVSEHVVQKAFDAKEGHIVNDFYIHDPSVNIIGDNYGDNYFRVESDAPGDSTCPSCGAKYIMFNFDKRERLRFKHLKVLSSVKKKHANDKHWQPRFMNCTERSRIGVFSRLQAVQDFFMKKIEDRKAFVKRIRHSVNEEAFIFFLLDHEMKKDRAMEKRGAIYRRGKSSFIKMDNKYNIGKDRNEIADDDVMLHVKDDEIDYDGIVDAYIREKMPDSIQETMLLPGRKQIDTSKFKKLDKFTRTRHATT